TSRARLRHARDARIPAPVARLCGRGEGSGQARPAARRRRLQPLRDSRDAGQPLRPPGTRGPGADESVAEMTGRFARGTAKEVGRLIARRRWKGSLATVVTGALLVIVSQAAAEDDELRRSLREAGLIPYWSFTPAASFSYPNVSTGRSLALAD